AANNGQNIRLTNTTAVNVTASANINSLTLTGTGTQTLSIDAGQVLTIAGTILASTAKTLNITGGGTLAFSGPDGILQTAVSGATINVNATTTGTGLTLAGAGTVSLNVVSNISGTNSVQTLNFGTVTGGAFQLQLGNVTTGPINYSSTLANL